MADRDDVLARLGRLEDERAVLRTLHRYCHAIDYGVESEWVDCFTSEGVFDTRYAAGQGMESARYSGRGELAAFIAQHPRAPKTKHKHVIAVPLIDLSGDRADASSYFELLLADDADRRIFAFGRYLDRLERCADGIWRFSLRIAEIESAGTDFPGR
ncbi:nuclear transport factor 2 family protein [Sphingobium phenoxybenzoativorans]|uniref:Nuclear transport factor 2 family protein n=1 Tax=Sphingobium phenoxybenzoativorans TaxID=1592790 RepID=A0A975K9W5_9SPHN|nr:nuclear transport factor 2 family protein [Sphingobium phenoxybenzoativorans]QUT06723.1 nuclear transport factor 2 family protein [Sphingobium phenoxybenzoativorans]